MVYDVVRRHKLLWKDSSASLRFEYAQVHKGRDRAGAEIYGIAIVKATVVAERTGIAMNKWFEGSIPTNRLLQDRKVFQLVWSENPILNLFLHYTYFSPLCCSFFSNLGCDFARKLEGRLYTWSIHVQLFTHCDVMNEIHARLYMSFLGPIQHARLRLLETRGAEASWTSWSSGQEHGCKLS